MMKFLLFFVFSFFSISLYSQNICFVMENFVRPYQILIKNFENNFSKNKNFIIKKENFWKIKDCKNVIVFGEDTITLIRKNYYSKEKNFIYLFAIYKNFIPKLKKNESLYYLQPEGEFILNKVKKILPNAKNWIVFYSGNTQKKYIINTIKFSAYYDITIKPIFAGKNINLNDYISKKNYDIFWFIPDNLYSSAYLINFILEKLIFLKKFSIGFNKFFFESGATISFKINYKKTAELIKKNFINKKNGAYSFIHDILINKKNIEYIKNDIK